MNSILYDFGFITIRWYSVFIFLGLLFGGALALREARRFRIPEDFMINLFFFLVPIALIGARLYYVAFHWEYYSKNVMDIFKVWEGGLAIHGAILFGLIWILIYSKKYKVRFSRLTDILCVSLILGQAIGRWGNFMNGEAFGPEVSLKFLESLYLPQFIIDGMFIDGVYHHPTFLYESLWCLIGFIILMIYRRRKYVKIGQTTSLYLIWYGIGRFLIESLRTDSLMLGNFKIAQIVSALMIVIGLFIFIKLQREPKLEKRYNDWENFEEVEF